jgi:hypothetical protein
MKNRCILLALSFLLTMALTGCFSNREYAVDYQVPNFFHYTITASTKGLGEKMVVFTNNIRGAITDTSFYSVSTIKVKLYNYDTNAQGELIATLYPTLSGDKLVCASNEAHETKLKLAKQVLVKVEAVRRGQTAIILEKMVYNGLARSGRKDVEIDFFTFTKSLIYKAWIRNNPTMDYADFDYSMETSNPYIDLAVAGVKEAIGEWNNLEYLDLDYKLAEPNYIADRIKTEKCYNLYCHRIPGLDKDGIFAGIRAQDIIVTVRALDGEELKSVVLDPDGSFNFSLPAKNPQYSIRVTSDYTDHWLGTDIIGIKTPFTGDYQLQEKDFVVR